MPSTAATKEPRETRAMTAVMAIPMALNTSPFSLFARPIAPNSCGRPLKATRATSRLAAAVRSSGQGTGRGFGTTTASSSSGQGMALASGREASFSPMRATISVTLSGAPRTSARPTRAAAASAAGSPAAISPISSSAT